MDRLDSQQKRTLTAFTGYVICYIIVLTVFAILTSNKLITLPFHSVQSLEEAYMRVVNYMPIFFISVFSLIWLKVAGLPVIPWLKWKEWKRPSWIFYAVFFATIAYTVYYLGFTRLPLRGYPFYPPVILLSILNAFAEEIYYRLILFSIVIELTRTVLIPYMQGRGLLQKIISNRFFPNVIQSTFYALIHLSLAGWELTLLAFANGMVMGILVEKHKSIIPAVICHIIVDLGVIGLPMLWLRT
ncbi:MAG: CPBP family intramembrane metalloprotease [bacterium]|nr:CPBP family intramembrane metalloprotease [bacterium]